MATTPNTRNKQDMRAKAEAAAVASACEFLKLKTVEAQEIYAIYCQGMTKQESATSITSTIEQYLLTNLELMPTVAAAIAPLAYERCASGAF